MREQVRGRWRRLVDMAPTIVQCSLACAIAWILAKEVVGHPRPFFAPIAVLICIGVASGRRLRRLVELVVGVSLGVGVGDLLILRIGSGAWQIALVVALAMAAAVLLDSGTVITLQAASSAVLVATLLPPTGVGGLDRMVDTLVGGLLGIAAVALLPPDLRSIARREAAEIFDALERTMLETAAAIDGRDASHMVGVLEAARGGQSAAGRFPGTLTTAREIAAISPIRWRSRRTLRRYEAASTPLEHALGNARVLARRTYAGLYAGEPFPPCLPDGLRRLARAVRLLQAELEEAREPGEARRAAVAAAETASAVPSDGTGFSAHVVAAQLRSIAVDVLIATGLDDTDAIAALPPVTHDRG
ncbi:FUSC family protein [Thermopolyspora sp. NPDC052614]|uniref:FUSC family protein n=1 Tax=Thermopolyspora sp. NPDC052614 TaxID=3155682 RepID=UPI00343C3C21